MLKKFLSSILILFLLVSPCFAGVDFDSSDDRVTTSIPDIGTQFFAVSIWVKIPSSLSTDSVVFQMHDNVLTDRAYIVLIASSGGIGIRMDCGGTGDKTATYTSGDMTDGLWHHLFFYRVATKEIALYIDGSLSGGDSYTQGGTVLDSGAITIIGNDDGFDNGASSVITEYALWSDATLNNIPSTQTEISLLAASRVKRLPLQIKPSTLREYIPLDDEPDGTSADGDTFADLSGNGNDGTGDDGANNTGLIAQAGTVLTYP